MQLATYQRNVRNDVIGSMGHIQREAAQDEREGENRFSARMMRG